MVQTTESFLAWVRSEARDTGHPLSYRDVQELREGRLEPALAKLRRRSRLWVLGGVPVLVLFAAQAVFYFVTAESAWDILGGLFPLGYLVAGAVFLDRTLRRIRDLVRALEEAEGEDAPA